MWARCASTGAVSAARAISANPSKPNVLVIEPPDDARLSIPAGGPGRSIGREPVTCERVMAVTRAQLREGTAGAALARFDNPPSACSFGGSKRVPHRRRRAHRAVRPALEE